VIALSERDDNQVEAGGGGRPGFPIEPRRLLHAVRARWQIVFAATVIGAFAGAAIAKKVVKQSFEATAVLAWESNAPIDLVTRQTTLESVALGTNLAYVRKEMGLTMPVRDVGNFFVVTSNQNSNIINIRSFWASADGAADMANALMRAFMENRAEVARDRLDAATRRQKVAVQEAELRSIAAAEAYEKFRREKGFSDITQEKELAIAAAAEAAAAVADKRRKVKALQDEIKALEGQESSAPPAMTDAERAQAKLDDERLPVLRGELATARVQFAEDHPTVLRLRGMLEALEARIKVRPVLPVKGVSLSKLARKMREAEAEQKEAEAAAAALQAKLDMLSDAEGEAALLLGEISVAKKSLDDAKQLLSESEVTAQDPPAEFRVLEEATPPDVAMSSPRKKVAVAFPAGFFALSLILVLVWGLRRGEVVTPKEAAFWAGVPVIGASTWPREPHMLASLMHDLDDFAAHCQGVTLTIGFSPEEAPLVQRVAEWGGHRVPRHYDPQKLLAAGGDVNALALREAPAAEAADMSDMQMLTLTGPVPAHALRRAARTADRVMVVVTSGRHGCLELARIRDQLGRDDGIGILLVGLPPEYATVRDRVGEIRQFWQATRVAAG
jgi:uncharacterized protein involved in exopolysaccharide biosynthesis